MRKFQDLVFYFLKNNTLTGLKKTDFRDKVPLLTAINISPLVMHCTTVYSTTVIYPSQYPKIKIRRKFFAMCNSHLKMRLAYQIQFRVYIVLHLGKLHSDFLRDILPRQWLIQSFPKQHIVTYRLVCSLFNGEFRFIEKVD